MKKLLAAALLIPFAILTKAQTQTQTKSQSQTKSQTQTQPDSAKQLSTVTVSTLKPYIIQKTDKITLDISQSPLAAGSSAWEALLRAPGISNNNGLIFRGRTALVLIDGHSTRLTGDDLKTYLDALPAGTIDKIEILPNPPARYDANGAAVIDIRTAKAKSLGAKGSLAIGGGAGMYGRYNGGATFQYRTPKLNLYSSYDYQHNTSFIDGQSERATLFSNSHEIRTRDNHSAQLGLDYDITPRQTIGLQIKGMDNFRARRGMLENQLTPTPGNPNSSSVFTTGTARFLIPSLNLYYRTRLDSAGSELNITTDYFDYNKSWSDRFQNTQAQNPKSTSILQDNSPARNTIRSIAADFTHPGKLIRWQAGLKTTLTRTDNDVRWQQQIDDTWLTDTGKTNHFLYRENIYAAYTSAAITLKKFDLNFGLRVEHTRTTGHSITLNQWDERQYTQLFPTLSTTYNSTEKQQWGLTYRTSILRPHFDILNPFIVYQSQFAYSQGNPYLQPSLDHHVELSYSRSNEWLGSLGYDRYVRPIAAAVRNLGDSGAIVATSENLSSGDMISLDLTWTRRLLNGHWTTSNNAGVYYLRFSSDKDHSIDKRLLSAYLSSNNQIMITKTFRGEINTYWYSPQINGAYHYRSMFTLGAGLSTTLDKGNGTLALNVSDIFNSAHMRYKVVSDGVFANNTDHTESRFVRLTLTWRLGNKNVKAGRTRASGIDEVKNRMSN